MTTLNGLQSSYPYGMINHMDDIKNQDKENQDKKNQDNRKKTPVVTILLIVLNVCIWAALDFFGDTQSAVYIASYGGLYPTLVLEGEWYRFFTAAFLHFGAEHLANNMILLGAAGSKLEQVAGSLKYLLIYIGAGLAGNLLSLFIMLYTKDYAVCAGASGAVFGIIGALLWTVIKNRGRLEELTVKGLLFMLALSFYNGVTAEGIDNWAHLGGAIGGFFLCMLFYRTKRRRFYKTSLK